MSFHMITSQKSKKKNNIIPNETVQCNFMQRLMKYTKYKLYFLYHPVLKIFHKLAQHFKIKHPWVK